MDSLEQKMNEIFIGRLPALSVKMKETVVKLYPWIMMIFGVLGLLAWLSSIKYFFGFYGLFPHFYIHGFFDIFMLVYYVIAPIVQVMAIYGGYLMMSRQYKGWRIALYALLIGFISHILYFSFFGVAVDVLFAYLLFQIKDYFQDQFVA